MIEGSPHPPEAFLWGGSIQSRSEQYRQVALDFWTGLTDHSATMSVLSESLSITVLLSLLMLSPLNRVPYKTTHNCNFATAVNRDVNICVSHGLR